MNELAFAAYTACCVLAIAAQLTFAFREWRALGRREPMHVDQPDVRVERYFGLAFRDKLQRWLSLRSRRMDRDVMIIRKDREEIRVHQAVTVPDGTTVEALLVADTLETGQGCRLIREVYTRDDSEIGPGNILQALATDGAAYIGDGTRVARWVDAAGDLVVGHDAAISGRATSAARVVLHAGARVKSVHAPLIVTVGAGQATGGVQVDPPATWMILNGNDDGWTQARALARRRMIAPDYTVYEGDLHLPTVVIKSNLVVHGDLTVGAHSVLERDVKATGSIRIGAQSTCRGNLVAGRDIRLDPEVAFAGVIFTEGAIRLSSGVSGARPDPGVAVYGAGIVSLGPDVVIRGKVSSGAAVVVADR